MKTTTQKRIFRFVILACLTLWITAAPLYGDEDYDPDVILQVPHQPILNNESLPGTTGNTGAMGYQIPIKAAPGRAGLQPELALVYNSSSRSNGWLGVGWSLDLGTIARSKKRRVNFDEGDTFVYNGSVELVQRSDWGDDYYGARIEEDFVKFRFLGDGDGWQVFTPDGRIYSYGTSGNAQLQTDQGVFKWYLDEVEDANGNTMSVAYDRSSGDDVYPESISYNPSGSRVVFYTESRRDVYPIYSGHTRVEPSRRLSEIRCYGSGSQAHRYVLDYGYSGHSERSLLVSVREYGSGSASLPAITFDYERGNTVRLNSRRTRSTDFVNAPGMTHFADINGDGFTDLIKFQENTTRTDVFLGDRDGDFSRNTNSEDMESYNISSAIHFGDIDGDGKADCVVAGQNLAGGVTARAYLGDSGGDLNATDQELILHSNTYGALTQLSDVNGDGRADLIEFPFGTTAAMVHLANSDGEFDDTTHDSTLCNSNASGRFYLADANGDGMADVIQTDDMSSAVYVHLADGTGGFDGCTMPTELGQPTDPGTLMFGDINGDGLSDIILAPTLSEMVFTYYADGNGRFVYADTTDTNQTNNKGYVHIGDVNGDGLADMVKCEQFGTRARLYLGDGTGYFAYQNYRSTENDGFAALVDTNNDGLADLVKFKTDNRYVYTYMAEGGLSDSDVHADILNEIDNGFGVVAGINYHLSTAYSYVHEPSSSFPDAYLPFPLDLVSSIVINDSIGHSVTTTYDYAGGHYDTQERELLGLGRITRGNPNDTTLSTTYLVGDYYFKGRASASRYDDNGSSDYISTTYQWGSEAIEGDSRWIRLSEEGTAMRSGGSTVGMETEYDYRYDSTDDFGYLYEQTRSGDGASDLITRTLYDEYGGTREWIIRLKEKRITQGGKTARRISYQYDGDGNPTRETHDNNDGSDGVIDRDFDSYGNITSETDLNGNETGYRYTDSTFVSRKSLDGLVTRYSNYNQWGQPGTITAPNGHDTDYDYDSFGRVTEEDYPGAGRKTISYEDDARPRYTVTQIADGTTTREYLDGLSRPLQSTTSSAEGREITTRLYYDGAGRIYNTAGPFFTSGYGYFTSSIPSSAPYRRITAFDFLNRPKSIEAAHDSGTATTGISYQGFNRTVTDPDDRSTTERRDYLGRIQTIVDALRETTSYDYTGAGDLTSVRDSMGHTIFMSRNTLGHMTLLDDPNLGRWDFTYKANGEVRTRTDEKGQTITYEYDRKNRVTEKRYSTIDLDVSYTYDTATNGEGLPATITKGNVTTTFNAYDQMGRVTRKTVTIDGQDYPFSYAYDAAGNLTRITYPDNYAVNYSYHSNSNLVASLWADGPSIEVDFSDYSNFGKPGLIEYPSVTTDIDYYSRTGRVNTIDVSGLMTLDYSYSRAGDVKSIFDSARNFAYTYDYDSLHRLTRETASGAFRMPGDRSIDLYYEGSEPHAVSRVVTEEGQRSLIYEGNGNLVIGYDFNTPGEFPERRLSYDADNMPVSIAYEPEGGTVVTTDFTYDGGGRRVKKESGGNTVIYVDETYEIRNGQPVKYVFAGSMRVAKVTGSEVRYYHRDHLGSATVVTDSGGNLMESLVYEAFGQPRATCQTQSGEMAYTYTDQEWDGESGLYNYDARLYDAVLGRFLTADSVVPDWYDPQALNRYTYALNNPMKFRDPNGHAPESIDDLIMGLERGDTNYYKAGARNVAETAPVVEAVVEANPVVYGMTLYSGESSIEGTPMSDSERAVGAVLIATGPIAKLSKYLKNTRLFKKLFAAKRGKTVLGKYPDYLNLADEIGAKRFNIPTKIWNKMTKAEQWTANQKFLDRMIKRGDDIILSNPVKNIDDVSGAFRQELDYLIDKGFRLSKDGSRMIK